MASCTCLDKSEAGVAGSPLGQLFQCPRLSHPGLGRKQGTLFACCHQPLHIALHQSSNLSESGADREACGWATRISTAEEHWKCCQCCTAGAPRVQAVQECAR